MPWREISIHEVESLTLQLQRELSSGHVLFGVEAKAVARSGACDDVLFELTGHEKPLALVHLAWGRIPQDPPWPSTEFFASWDEWVQEKLLPDHEIYNPDHEVYKE